MNVHPLFEREHHPVVITPDARGLRDLREIADLGRDEVDRLLLRHGAILFRGFESKGAEDFRFAVERLGASAFGYVGGNSPRSRVAADVYTSTEYPASEVITLHNEMSYLPRWPRRLFFYSVLPAKSGGQTSLASSRDVLSLVPKDIVARLRERKLTYIRNFQSVMPIGKNWQETYGTQDRPEVETIVASHGSCCTWLPGGGLRVSTACEALMRHPDTGEEVWFNQAEQWHPSALNEDVRGVYEDVLGQDQLPHDCVYGDGSRIDEKELVEVRRALDRSKLLFDWEAGDLLMLDNILTMHGREAFEGDRKVLAYLSAT